MQPEPMTPDDAAGTQPPAHTGGLMPGSTPSTWVGLYVVGAVIGLALMRRSFRRFT